MDEYQLAREKLDNAVYEYIKLSGTDADNVDYSWLDAWLYDVTGTENPLEAH